MIYLNKRTSLPYATVIFLISISIVFTHIGIRLCVLDLDAELKTIWECIFRIDTNEECEDMHA